MKKLIETLKNIWKIEDLRQRILITMLFVAIYRFGSFVVLPGINPALLDKLQSQTAGGLMSLLDMFSGGAFSNASIFALGIMPYISASIVMQLLAVAVPYFQKMQREGESGRKKIMTYTRYLTVAILLFQAPSYLINLKMQAGAALASGISWSVFVFPATIILAAGSMFILWLGERITDKGIGNGISLIIMIGIIARLPQAFIQEVTSRFTAISGGGLVMFLVEIIILYAVVCAAIVLVQGVRKVPVQYAAPENANWFVRSMLDHHSWTYNIIFAFLIIAFTYFYTAITLNPTQMAEDMKRNNGFIPGIKPGKPTADFIDEVMSRITLPGSLFIAFIAIMPALAGLLDVQDAFSQFFGGTSLLILVGVVLDTLQQIESHLLMRHYDGLLNSGRIHGRGMSAY